MELIRTSYRLVVFPFRLVGETLEHLLFRFFVWGIWTLYQWGLSAQTFKFVSEEGLDLSTAADVPRVYVSWHSRFAYGSLLLMLMDQIYVLTMPHKGWGNELLPQRALRKALFFNINRAGFKSIELGRHRSREDVVREMVKALQSGKSLIATGDGVRTGAFVAQLGAVLAASEAEVELVPYSAASTRYFRVNYFWDNFLMGLPFGTTYMTFGKPLRFKKGMNEEELETARQALAEGLNAVTHRSEDLACVRREYRLLPPSTPLRARAEAPIRRKLPKAA